MFIPMRCGLFVLICVRVLGGTSVEDSQQTVPPFMIHIGKIIEEEMRRQERTPAWLARKINCARPNVYYIFKQESINTDLLLRISQVLHHDFFCYYSKEV